MRNRFSTLLVATAVVFAVVSCGNGQSDNADTGAGAPSTDQPASNSQRATQPSAVAAPEDTTSVSVGDGGASVQSGKANVKVDQKGVKVETKQVKVKLGDSGH